MQNKYEKLARKEKESVINQREEKSSKVMGKKVKVCRSLSEKNLLVAGKHALRQTSNGAGQHVFNVVFACSTIKSKQIEICPPDKSKILHDVYRFLLKNTIYFKFSFSDLSGSCNRPLSQSSRNHTSFFNKQI